VALSRAGELAGAEHAERAGAALATLHRSRIAAAPWQDRTPRAAAELVRIVPALRREVERLLVEFEPGPPRPLHGAPHPPQRRQDDPRTPVARQRRAVRTTRGLRWRDNDSGLRTVTGSA
jgi:hypothetical protein